MMRRAARTDANQSAIVAALRQRGASVEIIARLGEGLPDLLVGYRRRNLLMEVKVGRRKLTPAEAKWHAAWRGQVAVVRSEAEALALLKGTG